MLKIFYLLSLVLFVLGCSQLPQKRTDKLSILQGVTNSKEVEFSVMAAKGQPLNFEMRSAQGEIIVPDDIKVISNEHSDYVVHKMIFLRDPLKEYNLYAYQDSKIIDQRLVGKGQLVPTKLKLAVASCMNDHFSAHFKIWDELVKKNPEYLLLIGDNVYADVGARGVSKKVTPEVLWKRYTDIRLTLPLYFQEKLIPTHAVWDDHDYGLNNGGEEYAFKNESKQIFETFFAQSLAEVDWAPSFGVGGLLSVGDYNLYFLDGRSFRAAHPDGRHLGMDQESWLTLKMNEEHAPSFIIKGDQFFGGYHKFESFEGNHPKDFDQFVGMLKKSETPFIFLSGDRHMSEIMQFPRGLFGKPSFEITSSPMHSDVFPDSVDSNPWRVVAEKAHMNFTIVENDVRDNHWFLNVENIGENGETFYRRELAVFVKDLQNNLNEVRKRRSGKRRYRKIRRSRNRR